MWDILLKKTAVARKVVMATATLAITCSITDSQRNDAVASEILKTQVYNDNYSIQTMKLDSGEIVDIMIINGPPAPPPGFAKERTIVNLSAMGQSTSSKTLTVPAFSWVFGCSSVSAAMIAGYYDRNGYPNMYTGPTNDGVMPMDNSTTYWPTWTDSIGDEYPNLPLAASKEGVDGRTSVGSIDDYWVEYNSTADDPYITGGWSEHSSGTAVGDYMKTSQSAYGNTDGATNFYAFTSSSEPLTCSLMEDYAVESEDGTYGRKLFYEARGYTVTDCYSQLTDNQVTGGFSFAQFKAEIDAGRPVMINLVGHTVVGIGYDDTSSTIYIHDTWDHGTHAMIWGESYVDMAMRSVSIVNLASVPSETSFPWQLFLPAIQAGGKSQ